MQHYHGPTRLVDFTADFWSAVYFALDGNESSKDLAVYRLKCRNEDAQNKGGNKLPKNSDGRPWRDYDHVDINQLLGEIIKYGDFNSDQDFFGTNAKWKQPRQSYGWDTPRIQNARVSKQKGFFLYNLDVTKTLEEEFTLSSETDLEKFVIARSLVEQMKEELTNRGYTELSLYLDLDRVLKKWTAQKI